MLIVAAPRLTEYFQCPPEHLTPTTSASTSASGHRSKAVGQHRIKRLAAFRFLYLKVLDKPFRGHELPYPK